MREWFISLRHRLRALLSPERRERELQDEIAFHLAMREEQLRRSGAPDSGPGARRRFGSASRIQDEMRDAWAIAPRLGSLLQDLRYAARTLVRNGSFAAAVILTLALGIGANTAVFSIVNSALIRPLGFTDADRLVVLHEGVPSAGIDRVAFSLADLQDVARDVRSFVGVGGFQTAPVELSGGGESERIPAARVTATLLPLLGAAPIHGRMFSSGEDRPGHDVAVISWDLWQRRYAGRQGIIGQSILIDRRPYSVIGIMPADFEFPRRGMQFNSDPADIWLPLPFLDAQFQRGGGFATSAIARLRDGATLAEARAELDVLAPRLQAEYPPALRNRSAAALVLFADPLRTEILGAIETPLMMLLAAIGLVLLVACANVANLFLSRAATRQHEISLRLALGATRLRLLQLQFSETLLLTLGGGVLGVLVAHLAVNAVPAVVTDRVPGLHDVSIDGRVLAFTAGLSIVTAVLFAVVSLSAGERRALRDGLLEKSARTTTGSRRHRIQGGLVVATVALSFVLLVGAGLFLRSFSAQLARDRGFRPSGVLTASIALPGAAYATPASVRGFQESLLQRVRALPGVRSAALSTALPLESALASIFVPEGADTRGTIPPTRRSWIQGSYFQTLGMSLRRGRSFTDEELAENRQVVVVNERLASRYWPGQDPIGKRIRFGSGTIASLTIIGVVSDAVENAETIAVMGDDRPVHVYEPLSTSPPRRDIRLAVLADGEPARLAEPIRRQLASLDPQLAVARIATMDERLSDVLAPQRFSTGLLTAFAIGALLLVSMGLYGLLAFLVAQRTREIGVRMALGAETGSVLRLVIADGGKLLVLGLIAGLVAALATTRFLTTFLYETRTHDPMTFVVVAIVLAMVGLLACGIPARRASRLDPLLALRTE